MRLVLLIFIVAPFLLVACSSGSESGSGSSVVAPIAVTPTEGKEIPDNCPSKNDDISYEGGATALKVGATAPEFILPPVIKDECNFRLSDLFGKSKQVLILHYGFWCISCVEQLDEVKSGHTRIEKEGAVVVAISPDDPRNVPFAGYSDKAYEYDFPSLTTAYISNGDDIYPAFIGPANGDPQGVVIVDEAGRIVKKFPRYFGDPATSVSQIVAALKEAN